MGGRLAILCCATGAVPMPRLSPRAQSRIRCDVRNRRRTGRRRAGLKVARFLTGSYVTSLDMAGASVTVSVLDDQAKELWDAPVHTAALRWGA